MNLGDGDFFFQSRIETSETLFTPSIGYRFNLKKFLTPFVFISFNLNGSRKDFQNLQIFRLNILRNDKNNKENNNNKNKIWSFDEMVL